MAANAREEFTGPVTEFGCGSFRGAEIVGPGSFRILNWFATPPRVRDGQVSRIDVIKGRRSRSALSAVKPAGAR